MKMINNGKYLFKFWVSLLNSKIDISEGSNIALDNNVFIRLTTSFEDERLSELYDHPFINLPYSNNLLEIVLEKNSLEDIPGRFLGEAEDKINKAIAIFRLFKKEMIGYNLLIQPLSENEFYGHTIRYLHYNALWAKKNSLGPYILSEKDIEKFKMFFNNFYNIILSRFELAIEYFNKSYIEYYWSKIGVRSQHLT
jgi:hypothetical protein